MVRGTVLVLALALCGTGIAASQLCSGEPTFVGGSTRLFGSVAIGQAETYHAGLAVGGTRLFGWGEAGMATYQRDESAEYGLGVGFQLSRRPEAKLHICPEIVLGLTGASDVGATGVGYDLTTASFGADAGYVVFRKGTTRIVPTANLQFVTGRIKWTYANGVTSAHGVESYGLLGAGIGVGLDEITASPSIIVPLGVEGAEVSYAITFSVKF
jgi:hypothetical protein